MVRDPIDLLPVEKAYHRDLTRAGRLIMRMSAEIRELRRQAHIDEISGIRPREPLGYGDAYVDNCPGLSTRARHALLRGKIETLYQLAEMPDYQLLALRNFGVGCLAEVHAVLNEYGLRK